MHFFNFLACFSQYVLNFYILKVCGWVAFRGSQFLVSTSHPRNRGRIRLALTKRDLENLQSAGTIFDFEPHKRLSAFGAER